MNNINLFDRLEAFFLNSLITIKSKYLSKKIIPISNILVGQQAGFSLEKWVKLTNEYERISLPITNSPYVTFLKDIIKNEKLLKNNNYLENSDYFKMGMVCIKNAGHFMGAKNKEELKNCMKEYYFFYRKIKNNQRIITFLKSSGHSKDNTSIILNKIKKSDCYEIVDGHHRIAIYYLLKNQTITAKVVRSKYSTLQRMLLRINQINDIELYQPVNKIDVKIWPVVRNCVDRFKMMKNFLRKNKMNKGSMIDLACSYGWFTYHFKKLGFNVKGIDRDIKAINIARILYNLDEKETQTIKIENFFLKNKKKYDVVLFLSILHHYAIGKEKGKVEEILKNLDRISKKVLFIDTGQNHEKWFKKKLYNWDDNHIIELIKKNTSFKKIIPLGNDKDNVNKYKKNYGRTLFVCLK